MADASSKDLEGSSLSENRPNVGVSGESTSPLASPGTSTAPSSPNTTEPGEQAEPSKSELESDTTTPSDTPSDTPELAETAEPAEPTETTDIAETTDSADSTDCTTKSKRSESSSKFQPSFIYESQNNSTRSTSSQLSTPKKALVNMRQSPIKVEPSSLSSRSSSGSANTNANNGGSIRASAPNGTMRGTSVNNGTIRGNSATGGTIRASAPKEKPFKENLVNGSAGNDSVGKTNTSINTRADNSFQNDTLRANPLRQRVPSRPGSGKPSQSTKAPVPLGKIRASSTRSSSLAQPSASPAVSVTSEGDSRLYAARSRSSELVAPKTGSPEPGKRTQASPSPLSSSSKASLDASFMDQTPQSRVTLSSAPPSADTFRHSAGSLNDSSSPLDRFLPSRPSPRDSTPSRPVSVLLKHGILSFNDPDSDPDSEGENDDASESLGDEQDTSENPAAQESMGDNTRFRQRVLSIAQERRLNSTAGSQANVSSSGDTGLRRGQARYRNLESENMELRLKSQQYREMNASEQEFTRIKVQSSRAEMRIDELTESSERKNAAIAQSSAERDAASIKYDTELTELHKDVEELEKSAAKYDAMAVARAASEIPDFIPQEAGSSELVETIRHLIERTQQSEHEQEQLNNDNAELTEQKTKLSDQVVQLGKKIEQSTTHNTELTSEVADLTSRNSELSDNYSQLATQNKSYSSEHTQLTARLDAVQAALDDRDSALIQRESEFEKMKQKMRELVDAHQHELDSTMESLTSKHFTESRALRHEIQVLSQTLSEKTEELEDHQMQHRRLAEREEALRKDLEDRIVKLQEIIHESKNASYLIIREFFGELFEVMGAEYQEEVETQIEDIVKRSKEESRSKIPLLTELLVQHTRRIALQAARSGHSSESNQRIWELEHELQALQSIVDTVWTRVGADQVSLAQIKDLKRKLKLEEEKRKSDWIEYQRVLHQHQNSPQALSR